MQKIGLLRKPAVRLLVQNEVGLRHRTHRGSLSSRTHRFLGLACCTGAGCDLLGVGGGGLAAA